MKYSLATDIVIIPSEIDPFSNPLWALFMRLRQNTLWDEFLKDVEYPIDLYSICFRMFPTEMMMLQSYDLKGINKMICDSLSNLSVKTKEEIQNLKSVAVISMDANPLYKYPVIEIQIVFLGEISDDSRFELKNESITTIFGLTGDVPIVEEEYRAEPHNFVDLCYLPVPEKNELNGLFNLRNDERDLTENQMEELEFAATTNIFELDLAQLFKGDYTIKLIKEYLNATDERK
jgi:hypothetical protein